MQKPKTNMRDDHGAVAVMLALLTSFVLLASGALAVDLGNAWARKRDVQKQVDVAALAAAHLLPVTSSADRAGIAQAVLDSMNLTQNSVGGQQLSSVTAANLLSSGLITFQYQAVKHGPFVSCNVGSVCTQMTVNAPNARVDFGLAAAMGKSHVDVSRSAVVRVSTQLPITKDVMPFWLPNGCSFGPAEPDTTQGNGNGGGGAGGGAAGAGLAAVAGQSSSPTATASPITPGTPKGQQILGSASRTTTIQTSTPTDFLSYVITNIKNNNVESGLIRFVSPDKSYVVDAAISDTNKQHQQLGQLWTGNFTVPPGVSTIAGDWTVYGLVLEGNGANAVQTYSNPLTLTVTPTVGFSTSPTATTSTPTGSTSATSSPTASATGIPVGCTGQDRGEFGQLESPRLDVANPQQALQYNISQGLDHNVVPYQFTDPAKVVTQCNKIDNSQPAHYNDDNSKQLPPYNNCIMGDTGNDGPQLYNGFISGISGNSKYPGRLNVSQGAPGTTCPNGNPNSTQAGTSDMVINGNSINNDVLSCYLENGATLATLKQDSGVDNSMLDGSITNSPRFIWLPVVYANDRTVKTWQPLKKYVPGFITDEDFGVPASSTNGLSVNGNSIKSFQVFTFNPAALPPNEQSPIVDYDPSLGNPIYQLVG